ncbi:NINE protein [Actinomyces ruminicola]|uniref:NINE protein n=1 Tax=Actinomyces ruminicola TaxID=332524 RepID=UPI0011C86F7E|nr:TM2 domain-containing protein [Actinomyces ruminicola]
MSQSPNIPDPGQSQPMWQPAGPGSSSDAYGQGSASGYAQATRPPAYGNGQPGYSYSQQPNTQQAAYAAPGYGVPYGQAGYVQPGYMQPKSKAAAAVLAFFLGGLGIHNFYRGQVRKGVIHLCLVAAVVVLLVIGGVIIVANTDDFGYTPDGPSAAAGFSFIFAALVALGNCIWALVEFIMILVSSDGSLR